MKLPRTAVWDRSAEKPPWNCQGLCSQIQILGAGLLDPNKMHDKFLKVCFQFQYYNFYQYQHILLWLCEILHMKISVTHSNFTRRIVIIWKPQSRALCSIDTRCWYWYKIQIQDADTDTRYQCHKKRYVVLVSVWILAFVIGMIRIRILVSALVWYL